MEYLKLLRILVSSLFSLLLLHPRPSGLNVVLQGGCAILVLFAILWRLCNQCKSIMKSVRYENTQINPPKVVSKVAFEEIVDELQPVTRWFDLGLHLGVPAHKLHQLKSERVCVELKRIKVLKEWTNICHCPSWSRVVTTLVQINETQLANHIALKYGITVQPKLEKPSPNLRCVPEMVQLTKELQGVLEWFELGLHLGIPESKLKAIEQKNNWNIEGCKQDMLMEWIYNSEPRWQNIIDALKVMKRSDLVDFLASKYNDSLSTAHTVLDVSAYDDHSAVTSFLANAYVLLHLMFCSFMFVFFPGWCSISIITTSVYSSLHLMSSVSISLWTSISVVVVIIIWFVTISSEVTSQDIMFYEQKKDEVTFKELLHDLKEVVDWWSFGKAVNLSHIQLLTIHQEGKTTDKCRALMIEKWMKLEKPTWSTIVSSLFKCGLVALGWRLAAKHNEPVTSKMIKLANKEANSLYAESNDSQHNGSQKAMTCPSGHMNGIRGVSVKDLLCELNEVTSSWFELGAFLDIPESKLREIFHDYADVGVEECMIEMIITWRQLVIPTWKAIIAALTGIGMSKLAIKIANKYNQPYPESLQKVVKKIQSENAKQDLGDNANQQEDSTPSRESEEKKDILEKMLPGGISLDQMLIELENVTVRWFMLGIYLGVDDATLKAIREDKIMVEKCKVEMLIKWSFKENPTWEKLIIALLDINESTVAIKIATKYRVPLPQSLVDKLKGKVSTEELKILEVVQAEINESTTTSPEKVECEQLSLQQLSNELKDVVEWFHFGVCLGVSTSKLQIIQRNYGRQGPERCKIEMLLYWLQQKVRSWLEVIKALTKMGMRTLAQKIAVNYSIPFSMNDISDSTCNEEQELTECENMRKQIEKMKCDYEEEKRKHLDGTKKQKLACEVERKQHLDELKKVQHRYNEEKQKYDEVIKVFELELKEEKERHASEMKMAKLELQSVKQKHSDEMRQLQLDLERKVNEQSGFVEEREKYTNEIRELKHALNRERMLKQKPPGQDESLDQDKLLEELQKVKTNFEEENSRNHAEINRLTSVLETERQEREVEVREITFALNKEKKKYRDLSKEHGQLERLREERERHEQELQKALELKDIDLEEEKRKRRELSLILGDKVKPGPATKAAMVAGGVVGSMLDGIFSSKKKTQKEDND